MSDVEFFFDYSCPWSYLALHRLRDTSTRTGARIRWKPVLLDQVLQTANPGWAGHRLDPNPARAEYRRKDLQDWAHYCGAIIHLDHLKPRDTTIASSGALIALKAGLMLQYSERVFRAHFEHGENIESRGVVRRLGIEAGLEEERLEASLGEPNSVKRIRRNSEELLERGGFGSPTFYLDGVMFFGNDRMPLVEFAIGQASNRTFVAPGNHSAGV